MNNKILCVDDEESILRGFKLNLRKDFELSQNFFMFYDKLEKAYAFLKNIEDTKTFSDGERIIDHLLNSPIDDGGEWGMFLYIVNKYGVVPQECMPESRASSNSGFMNKLLKELLRQHAHIIRTTNDYDIDKMMRHVHRTLCISLGCPPAKIEWTFKSVSSKKKLDDEETGNKNDANNTINN